MAIDVKYTLDFDGLIDVSDVDSVCVLTYVIEDYSLEDEFMELLENQFDDEDNLPTVDEVNDFICGKEVADMVLNNLQVNDFANFEDILATLHFINVRPPYSFLTVDEVVFMSENAEKTLAEIVA